MSENAELIFVELFHFLFSWDDELNIAQVIIYSYILSFSIDSYEVRWKDMNHVSGGWIEFQNLQSEPIRSVTVEHENILFLDPWYEQGGRLIKR